MDIKTARKLLLDERNPQKALEILKNSNVREELLGSLYLDINNFEAALNFYESTGNFSSSALCCLFLKDIEKARELLKKSSPSSIKEWCESLVDIFTGKSIYGSFPSYLQVRNRLEADFSYLLRAKNMDFASLIVHSLDLFDSINGESSKFIGRAFFYNGYLKNAGKFLARGARVLSEDPEVYYYLAQHSFVKNNISNAKSYLNISLDINSDYYPSKAFLEKLKILK